MRYAADSANEGGISIAWKKVSQVDSEPRLQVYMDDEFCFQLSRSANLAIDFRI